ncbi:guanylate cyclase [Legionella geestiana]|uniref:Guanylate cyclase n=1 Tax=Legionella geestiana TaxID=45065 RepID=A0A0W0TSD1_9GAMM|nr:adenylate/guanylate cyclase domain-containing protein [Legionella geestiana]KTC98495.1 guanylate cyclase [Legionella geestiana]QBS13101.1 adenylate/guanylate cyclase domain-containing protein [Legionella geestiana]QDQ39218.1 adenylate/guanylate cyclase domain-containing protein [Legionella geestiana]STX54384.1 guanylate cyclase [Legionella geestiana]
MELSIKRDNNLKFFILFLSIFFVSLLGCLFTLRYVAEEGIRYANIRYESYVIATELRQSSDDLTKMVRLYVVTGKKKYRDYYNEILSIRDGTSPRPLYYNQIYWDLVTDGKRPTAYGPPESEKSKMLKMDFTMDEFALLSEANHHSQALTKMEILAMNAREGKFDDGSGSFSIPGKPDIKLAEDLVFSDKYMQQKAQIMSPIQAFYYSVTERTKAMSKTLDSKIQKIINVAIIFAILSTFFMIISIYKAIKSLSNANNENDILLLNVLPSSIVSRLKKGEADIVDEYPQASILFADIVNFTSLTKQLGAKDIVSLLNHLFDEFDALLVEYNIEKIKTIGDNYMAVSGVPNESTDHAIRLANYALAMVNKLKEFNTLYKQNLQLRIGMSSGFVIAGIIGRKKFVYDVWGNVVNLASRLETVSEPDEILVSEKMAMLLEDDFILEPRDPVELKGLGSVKSWILKGKKLGASSL